MQHVLIVINKDESALGASETFLRAHIDGLPCKVSTLIGNPGYRCVNEQPGRFLLSRSFGPLAIRWLSRKVLEQTVAGQDIAALEAFIKDNKVDAVLAEYGPTAVSVMDACERAGVPLIAQFHGYDAYRLSLVEQNRDAYQQLFRKAAAVIGVSKDMCAQLEALGCPADKLTHNACGAEIPETTQARPETAGPRFVMVGRLVEKKAPFLSIMAFAKVKQKCAEASLSIVGDGHLMDGCRQLARALGVEESIQFHGSQAHGFVMSELAESRCFIQHSVTAIDGDKEGTPVGVLEAMGMGLVVVSTRHGGIMDIIEDGRTGYLVDEYDVDAMAEVMMGIAKDGKSSSAIGIAARTEVLKSWTSEKSVDRLWNVVKTSM